jgi:[CysO sulfur-carrier protein]-S-L-cysteine hydrolase
MRIPRPIYDELFEQAREELPDECCGMIGGSAEQARTLYRARNSEASPLRYSLDPRDQIRINGEMEERDEELAAIYHSHTKSPAYPSQTDINLAFMDGVGSDLRFPGTIYLIASLAEGEEPLRGFTIEGDGSVKEVELEIE